MSETLSLAELQYNLKRDHTTYKPDFERYYERYQALEQSFACAPSQHVEKLEELLLFISQVINFYQDYVDGFSGSVTQTLLSRSFGMHPGMRAAFMKAFMRLKTKDLISLDTAIDVAFKLHRCHDKQVRLTMRNFLVHDIKRLNRRQKLNKVNSAVQTYLAKVLKDNNPTVAREAVFILVRLFKKNVWNDARTANLIADACLAKRKKVYAPAVRFFLGHDKKVGEKDSDSDSEPDVNKETKIKQLRLGHRVGCKTKRRQKRLERSIEHVNKEEQRKSAKKSEAIANLVAINLLYDPQTFAEKLLRKLERCSDRFEIRLLLLDLISRLVGLHKLVILNLYPFIQRFLRPHQREVTRLLLFTAQASHDEVPPDVMEPVLRAIADNFVTERASSEAIAVGLNATREICARCPYAISTDLLSDLIQYRIYKNKNVVAAARSLIRLYRVLNPAVLPRKDRGRPTEAQLELMSDDHISSGGLAIAFGKKPTAQSVPGAEALVLTQSVTQKEPAKPPAKSTSDWAKSTDIDGTAGDEDADKNEKEDDDETKESQDVEGERHSDDNDSWHTCCDSDEEEDSEVDQRKRNRVTSTDNLAKTDVRSKKSYPRTSDDGWIDVTHSSDEENNMNAAKVKMNPNELSSEAVKMASSRIFTQEEFEAMRKYQQFKQKRFASVGSGRKRQADESESFFTVDSDDSEEADQTGQLVSLSAITRLVKRPKQTKAERLEAIEDGRTGREKYGYKVHRMNPHASTTNREKSKGKAFPMIKHKVRQKAKRSFRDKQIALRDQLRHMLKHMRS